MKASDLLVQCLETEGVEFIFGVPGEENADFMMSLEKSSKIRFVLTRHEQGAAFMAEIYGRLTGNPAACLSTLGPGATNLITGVADANMDHAPMLVLTGQGSTDRLHKESHQIMDVVAMFEPLTKWATQIIEPSTIPEVVRKAVRISRTEKPGAVLVELPEDIAAQEVEGTPMKPIRYLRGRPARDAVIAAADRIRKAKSPVILAGNGCVRKRASEQLRALTSLTGIGVLNTFMGKGAISPSCDESLFTIGLGAKDVTVRAIEDADLVIAIGFDMVEYHPKSWNPHGEETIVHIDFMPAEIDASYHPEVELVGDIADSIEELTAELRKDASFSFDFAVQKNVRKIMQKDFAHYADDDAKGKIKPQKALADAQAVFGESGLLLSDVGAHKMWIARHYHCEMPNACLIPNGFCSMGFALPGAIAASLVDSERSILAICGDAGFLMNVQEMETARRLNSNITVMVWEDKAYGLIEWKQDNEFGHHTDLSFTNPEWSKLADSFGWDFHFVDDSAQLESTLKAADKVNGPSLVVIPIDYEENKKLAPHMSTLVELAS